MCCGKWEEIPKLWDYFIDKVATKLVGAFVVWGYLWSRGHCYQWVGQESLESWQNFSRVEGNRQPELREERLKLRGVRTRNLWSKSHSEELQKASFIVVVVVFTEKKQAPLWKLQGSMGFLGMSQISTMEREWKEHCVKKTKDTDGGPLGSHLNLSPAHGGSPTPSTSPPHASLPCFSSVDFVGFLDLQMKI